MCKEIESKYGKMLAIVDSSGGCMADYSELFFQLFSIFKIFHNKKIGEEEPKLQWKHDFLKFLLNLLG